ncbi:MAG: helix-turn-helix domain-containing protein [Paracoccaceae bacterium]
MLDQVAFGALVKRKRGEMRLTQETLAGDIFGDSTRKADISRIENGKVTPQEATIQKLCTALDISPAEMEHIRQARPTVEQLANIPALSREELQNLAARFGIENPYGANDTALRSQLTHKADDYRKLLAEVESLKGLSTRIDNIHSAAMAALRKPDLEEARRLIEGAKEIHQQSVLLPALEANEKLIKTQVDIALLQGDVEEAYRLLRASANSFDGVNSDERILRMLYHAPKTLRSYALRFGGNGFEYALALINEIEPELVGHTNQKMRADALIWKGNVFSDQGHRTEGPKGADLLEQAVTAYRAALEVHTRTDHPVDWAMTQNNLGAALGDQGNRTEGPKGVDLLEQAVTAYRAALEVRTRTDHPVDWARTQNNLGNALGEQGNRTEGPKGADLLEQAVTAYRAALEVRTRTDHPVSWASTQENIATVLKDRALRSDAKDSATDLAAALDAVDLALEVYDPEHMSYRHGTATELRQRILSAIDALSDPKS